MNYPSALCVGDIKHEELFRFVRLGKISKALKILRKDLITHKDKTVFLSTESIVNQLDNIEDSRWVELFEGLKKLGCLELLIVVREPVAFLKSYYKQAVVNQPSSAMSFYATPLTLDDFSGLASIQNLLDYPKVIEKLERLSGSSIRVFEYGADIVDDILTCVVEGPVENIKAQRSNESLKPEEVELIRQINALGLSSGQRNAWFKVMSHSCSLNSQTALSLASRANYEDLLALDANWLLNVRLGQNENLGVNDNKLMALSHEVHQWLVKYQHAHEVKHLLSNTERGAMSLKKAGCLELECCVQKKLLQLSNHSRNKALGEKLFAKQQLELAPFKAVPFSGWGEWEKDPLNNRSWQWRLNWLSFLSYLIAFHRTNGEEAVLDTAREAIQSWLDTYLDTDTSYPFEFIWHDHATALRAEQLVLFAYYCREHATEWASKNSKFLTSLEQALVVHGQRLAKDSFYSEHTNHGLEQARVLLLLGTVFEGGRAREWQQIAIRRISSELTFAFTEEGVHVENSPAYHIFVFKVFLGIIKDYPEQMLGDLAEQFNQFSNKALSFITHVLRPDGKLPPIGDTEQLPTSDAYREMFGHRLEYQYFLYALTQGEQGVRPPVLNCVYPKSGYAIFRDHWPIKEHYQKAFHLIAKVGCSSRYHHQQDESHVSLYAGGEDWLIDSGLYNYINNDPVRKYMRGRHGHNVPLISHANYHKNFDHRLKAWEVLDYSIDPSKPFLCMKLDVLVPVAHERRVEFDAKDKIVEIKDKISSGDGEYRDITLQWHFPKDKKITIEDEQVTVTSRSGNLLHISFEGKVPDSLSVVKGRKEERVFSCISYKANQVEPSQMLRVVFKSRAGLEVTTKFAFEMSEEKVAPAAAAPVKNVQSLGASFKYWQRKSNRQHSVVLGADAVCIKLAKAHRAKKIGKVDCLASGCGEGNFTDFSREDGLSEWLSLQLLNVSGSYPFVDDRQVLQGFQDLELLVISGAGFSEKEFAPVLVSLLPSLFKCMADAGQVWVNDSLPEELKTFCLTWAIQHNLSVKLISGLEEALAVPRTVKEKSRMLTVVSRIIRGIRKLG
ncbi:heparinase II/III family protein [Billgrantia tianxiuensis]|uniref:heparinase II/III family protein n=1 Tax=Halomonadaceae TaxID=28256 RepID=UPI00135C90F8|nr:heparinase II/III family protein [Halomonas tianxiuensis]MCE8031558.1 hypothetical protein [Halomonas sp. MCCC 1A11057]